MKNCSPALIMSLGSAQNTARLLQQEAIDNHDWQKRDDYAAIASKIDAIIRDITAA